MPRLCKISKIAEDIKAAPGSLLFRAGINDDVR